MVELVYGTVHLEDPLHGVPEARRDKDGGRAQPETPPRSHGHGEAPDVVEVPMGDEEELLETALCGRFGFSVFKEIWFLKKTELMFQEISGTEYFDSQLFWFGYDSNRTN